MCVVLNLFEIWNIYTRSVTNKIYLPQYNCTFMLNIYTKNSSSMKSDSLQLTGLGLYIALFILTCLLVNVNGQSYHWSNGWKPGKRAQSIDAHNSHKSIPNSYMTSDTSYQMDDSSHQNSDTYNNRDASYQNSDTRYQRSDFDLWSILNSHDTLNHNIPLQSKQRVYSTNNDINLTPEVNKRVYSTNEKASDTYLKSNTKEDNHILNNVISTLLLDSQFNEDLSKALITDMLTNSEMHTKDAIPYLNKNVDDVLMTKREYEGLYKLTNLLVNSREERAQSCKFNSITRDRILLLIREEIRRMKTCEAIQELDHLVRALSSNTARPFNDVHRTIKDFADETQWK